LDLAISINLVNAKERQSFFTRNKDQLVVASVAAIIGTIIGGVAVWIITTKLPQ
jgi:hypothetical protein